MIEFLAVPALAFINRVRGGGCKFFNEFPLHTRVWASLMVFIVLVPMTTLVTAAALAGAWFIWALLPWGRWYDLGRMANDPERKNTWLEAQLSKVGNDHVAFTLRNVIALVPAAIISPYFMILAFLQTLIYEAAWTFWPSNPIRMAEYIMGAAWGLAFVILL